MPEKTGEVTGKMENFKGPYPALYLLHGLTENSKHGCTIHGSGCGRNKAGWLRIPTAIHRYLMRCIQERNAADGCNRFPDFYVACGLQDPLIDANRSVAEALKEAGADVTYEESDGIHDWYLGMSISGES